MKRNTMDKRNIHTKCPTAPPWLKYLTEMKSNIIPLVQNANLIGTVKNSIKWDPADFLNLWTHVFGPTETLFSSSSSSSSLGGSSGSGSSGTTSFTNEAGSSGTTVTAFVLHFFFLRGLNLFCNCRNLSNGCW